MTMTMVTVLPSGPPRVRMKNWSKASSEPVMLSTSISAIVGRSSGSVMWRNTCQRVAPSIRAAS